ncbi:MAG: DUF5103 domain-containing protein [Bacteroidaceae bacterium]|nr:DUF5103 domain-containing protein [Bacteroidaceae bacterium]
MKRLSFAAALLAITSPSWGDGPASLSSKTEVWAEGLIEEILSPRIIACGDWMRPPVITLGTDETLEFSFDRLSKEPHQFNYHIDHCDADWEVSDLQYSEYMDGFDNEQLYYDDYSRNTTFDYTHFSLTVPNEMNTPILSGNYKLTISESDFPVAVFRFCVVEPAAAIKSAVSDITDIDTRETHQQVTASVESSELACFDAREELKLTVMQNMRFDNAARMVAPDFIQGSTVIWQHCEPMIFDAGNGFRRFEITDFYANTQNVDKISYYDPFYHAMLCHDEPGRNFRYEGDHGGRMYIRSTETGVTDYDTEADYVFVHFELYSDLVDGGSPYIYYQYDGAGFSARHKMQYRGTRPHCYEAVLPLKMGSYDYQYLWVPDGANRAETGQFEGNFHQTGNEYMLFLYQRRPGDRYDRLVGYSTTIFK